MELLITGGNGFVGRNLIVALQERGDSTRVLALPSEDTTWLEKRGVKIFRGDVCQPDTLIAPMRGVDGVFHLAAMTGVWRPMRDYYAVNVNGTGKVCREALRAGVSRIIHISSVMVYNTAIGRPVTEDDPLDPLDEPYCKTKAEGDKLVQRMIIEDHLPAVIIRSAIIFGPGDSPNFGRVTDRARTGKSIIIGSGNNAVPLVYITDLVQGLLLAMDSEHAMGQAYNISNDRPISQKEFLSSIAQEIGAPAPRMRVPYSLLYSAAYSIEHISRFSGNRIPPFLTRHGIKLYGADNRLSIDKARRELGYEPQVPILEGIRLAAAWYKNQDSWTLGDVPVSVPQV